MHDPFDPHWDRLPHLFAGELPDDEAHVLGQWIDAVPERREMVERMRQIWQLTAVSRVWDADAGLAAVRRRVTVEHRPMIAQVEPRPPLAVLQPRRRGWLAKGMAAAAAVLLVAGGATVWQLRLRSSLAVQSPVAFTEFTTRFGQRLTLRLHDGTLVTLAPGSKLRQPSTYGRADRTLHLDGEAAFVVTHDAARPFVVRAPRAVARDLGTRFVVRAYATDPATDVVVAEGMVAVQRADRARDGAGPRGADSAVLVRGERARIGSDGALQRTSGVALDPYFAWTDGQLVFRDTPLAEVARQLSRWHDVEVHLADSMTATRRLTAVLGDESVAEIMHRIAVSLDLDVRRADRTFTLRAR